MPTPKYKTAIFDLDGTLIKSDPGILNGIRHALAELGVPFPAVDTRKFLGPPLRYSFQVLAGMDEEKAQEAVRIFRAYYGSKGLYEAELYPGIREMLEKLRESGVKICLATSKFEVMGKIVLEHFGLSGYLDYASMSSGKELGSAKKEIVGRAIAHSGNGPQDAVMIGDTIYDVEGARENGLDFIGVLYGYGTRAEMEKDGARVFARDAEELLEMLFV